MIYIVECAFTDPAREDAWNAYYNGDKLTTLLSLPGFRASQRFRAIADTPSPYLAVHSLRDAAVLDQPAYRAMGGGTFQGWDALVTNWHRNLFTGMEAAPEVRPDQCLVMLDNPDAADRAPGVSFTWLDIAGLDRSVARRGLGIVSAEAGAQLAQSGDDGPLVFAPISKRLVSPHGIDC